MRKLPALLFSTLVLAVAACGGDSNEPSDANVEGTWRVRYNNLETGNGVVCNTTTHNVVITQVGSTFTGTYGPLTLTCTNGSESVSDNFAGEIVNGEVDLNDVVFDLDTQELHQTGSVNSNGTTMSGTSRWDLDVGEGQHVILNGDWTATKQ